MGKYSRRSGKRSFVGLLLLGQGLEDERQVALEVGRLVVNLVAQPEVLLRGKPVERNAKSAEQNLLIEGLSVGDDEVHEDLEAIADEPDVQLALAEDGGEVAEREGLFGVGDEGEAEARLEKAEVSLEVRAAAFHMPSSGLSHDVEDIPVGVFRNTEYADLFDRLGREVSNGLVGVVE